MHKRRMYEFSFKRLPLKYLVIVSPMMIWIISEARRKVTFKISPAKKSI